MYCSSCGLELPHELVYCSRCGNNLRPASLQPFEALERYKGTTAALITAIVLVTLGGFFAALFVLMAFVTRGMGLAEGGGLIMALFLAVTLGIDWGLLRLLTRILNLPPAPNKTSAPATISEPAQYRLNEPRVPVDSVTDHTTRTLPPVYVELNEPR